MNNDLIHKVSKQTNVSKEDILMLSKQLESKDFNNEKEIRSFITTLAKVVHKDLTPMQIQKLTKIIQNKQIPEEFKKMAEK